MKKLLLLLALVGMVAYGCTDSSTDDDHNPPTNQPGPSGDEDLAFTNNTNTAPTISHEGGTAKISFTAALSWSVSVYADWLSVSDDEGEAGNGSFVITAEANDGDKERKGVVAIKLSNNKSYEITVKQSFNADSDDIEFINNSNTAPHMEYGGGTVQIAFIAKTDWTVTCYADWLSTSKSSGSKGENSFFITAASNPKEEERSGVVAIKSKNNKSYEIKVTQDPNAGIMQLTVAANEVLYTTVFDTQIKLYNESGFGGNLISHSYDVEKGYGSIRFDNYVTSIPSQAFKDCSTLESIYLPEGVTYIAPDAFEGCTNLKYIISPKSTNYSMFIYNGELMAVVPSVGKELVIPEGVKIVDQNIFTNSKVEKIVFPISMENIKYRAFYQHPTLQSVVFNGHTNIDDYAFNGCYSLESVTYAVGNEYGSYKIGSHAFEKCEKLKTVQFAEGLSSLGEYAFSNSGKLESVAIPNGVTKIGRYAFESAGSLKLTIPESVKDIGYSAFSMCKGEITINTKLIENDYTDTSNPGKHGWLYGSKFTKFTIGDSITRIGKYAFCDCSSLTSLAIGKGVAESGEYAFTGCSSLTSVYISDLSAWCKIHWKAPLPNAKDLYLNGNLVTELTIPSNITIIKGNAFSHINSLTSVTIPNSVTSIEGNAFAYCSKLTNVSIGEGVILIGSYAFYRCSSMTSITIPDSVTSIGNYAFDGCSGLISVVIGNGVTRIEPDTFSDCKSLTSLIIGNSVTLIGSRSFSNCKSLTSVTFPNSITSIAYSAFSDCSSLTSITIPDSVTSIGASAFNGCSSLKSVYCKPTTPPKGQSYMFEDNAVGRKIYVPRNSVKAYESAEKWSEYASDILGYDF